MRFLSKIFPTSISSVRNFAIQIIDRIKLDIEEYDELLRSHNIPIPERSEFDISIIDHYSDGTPKILQITLPTFILPNLIFLRVRPNRYCTLAGEEKVLEEARTLFSEDYTLRFVLLMYGDKLATVWTSFDPYEIYGVCHGKSIKFNIPHKGELKADNLETKYPINDLKQATKTLIIPPWSNEELELYENRLKTVIKFTSDYKKFPYFADNYRIRTIHADLFDPKTVILQSGGFLHPHHGKQEDSAATYLTDYEMQHIPVCGVADCDELFTTTLKIIPKSITKLGHMKEFLKGLSNITKTFVFYLEAADNSISFNIRYMPSQAELIEQQVALHFPQYETIKTVSKLPTEMSAYGITYFVPLYIYRFINMMGNFQIDPYRYICGVLNQVLDEGKKARFEVWCKPFSIDAMNTIANALRFNSRQNYKSEEWCNAALKDFQNKIPVWALTVGWTYVGEDENKRDENYDYMLSKIKNALNQYQNNEQQWQNNGNKLDWGVVSLDELLALVHFPTEDLHSDYLELATMKNKLPPPLYQSGTTLIGTSEARSKKVDVFLPEEVRDRHTYIVGKSGTGKSTLVESIVLQDIENGFGCAVIDPHGDMIQHILERMPEHRINDCVLFNPEISPISLELLAVTREHEINLLSDNLLTMFKRTSESWGDKMHAILQMTFQTLLRVPGSSFSDISRLLTDQNYRNKLVSQINHPPLTSFWQNRYIMREADPILIRMDRLTTSAPLRSILTQHEKSLNFYDVITEGKIFLADLSNAFLGEPTSHLLGSIIVSQIQFAAMRQARLPIEQRVPFSLFVDEFQNFTTGAFATILSEARKYKLRLTIAHQFISQIPIDIQKAIFGNVGTMIFFGMSPDDLGAGRDELGSYQPTDVANLQKYQAFCRPITAARDTFTMSTLPLRGTPNIEIKKTIIEQTKRDYYKETELKFPVVKAPNVQEQPNLASVIHVKSQINPYEAKIPAKQAPLSFPTNTEKIMHFLRQSEYLSQPQINAIANLQASNASTALKKLVETKQINSLEDRRPKIYFIGKANPTTHNLLIRDLFVKISNSEFKIHSISFNKNLGGLNPDLAIEFVDENNQLFSVYFEIDRGFEGVGELISKAKRYRELSPLSQVGFIFEKEADMKSAQKKIDYPFITFAVLNTFTTLNEPVFYHASDTCQLPFFIN